MRRPSCRNQRRGGSERSGCRPAHRPLVRTARVTRDTQLGVYEAITPLGERAMGEVHRAPCAMRLANYASVVAQCLPIRQRFLLSGTIGVALMGTFARH
jgi:hypothetical protein